MDKRTIPAWERLRPTKRRLIQLYAALLYNAHIKGFVKGEIFTGNSKALCVPGLNCYSCPGAAGACPLGALQNALSASGNRAGFYVLGILLLYGLLLGRTICGWLCPFGLLQELLHKIPTPKIPKSRITRGLSWLKYGILAVFAILIPLWYGLREHMTVPGFCKLICPAGTLEGAIALLANSRNEAYFAMLGRFFTLKFVILLAVGLLCIFCYRGFCRFLCPLGAIYSLFGRLSLVGVRVDPAKCDQCGACVRCCPMDVQHVGDHECIHCGRCTQICAQGSITIKAGKYTLFHPGKQSEKRREFDVIAWCIALAILAGMLLWCNWPERSAQTEPPAQVQLAVGYEVGEILPDFEITCTDGTVFRLSDTRGKVTVINLWATYCGPCVKELPYFDAFHEAHPDTAVLAVHSSLVTDDVGAYLAQQGWNLQFAIDPEDSLVWNTVGGNSTIPQTIVLDPDGTVIYNQRGSVTPELLEELYQQALQP